MDGSEEKSGDYENVFVRKWVAFWVEQWEVNKIKSPVTFSLSLLLSLTLFATHNDDGDDDTIQSQKENILNTK